MNLQTFIKVQKAAKNKKAVKLKLLQAVFNFLIETTNDNLKKVVRQIAILSKSYNIPLHKTFKVKTNNLEQRLLQETSDVIVNKTGFAISLPKLLNFIVAYANSKFLEIEF